MQLPVQAIDAELEEITKAAENLTVATDFSLQQMNAHFARVSLESDIPPESLYFGSETIFPVSKYYIYSFFTHTIGRYSAILQLVYLFCFFPCPISSFFIPALSFLLFHTSS